MKGKRRLRNVQLTKNFHYRHHGIWIAVCFFLILVANLLWCMMILASPTQTFTTRLAVTFALELTVSFLFVTGLAKFTSHRIAGPFIKMRALCDRIAEGETDLRVHFRESDGLDELEASFNAMLDRLAPAEEAEPGGSASDAPGPRREEKREEPSARSAEPEHVTANP